VQAVTYNPLLLLLLLFCPSTVWPHVQAFRMMLFFTLAGYFTRKSYHSKGPARWATNSAHCLFAQANIGVNACHSMTGINVLCRNCVGLWICCMRHASSSQQTLLSNHSSTLS
jgi:hypothetical protein